MNVIAFGVRAVLVVVFGVAAVGKLVDREAGRRALGDFHVPQAFVRPVSWVLPLTEMAVSVLLLVQPLAGVAAVAAAGLLALFACGIAAAMFRGEAPDCNCFGQIGSKPAGPGTLARNAALAAAAVFVAVNGPGVDPGSWLKPAAHAEIAVLLLVVGVIGAVAVLASLWVERQRLRTDLELATASLALFPPGLPVGAPAPDFSLTRADGAVVTLENLLSRGCPVALVFVSPSCRPCHFMFPDIARWQRTLADRLTITLIVHGRVDEAHDLCEQFGLMNMLSDHTATMFRAYRGQGTPSMVIINPDGTIGIRIRSSHGAVEAAIRRALQNPMPPATNIAQTEKPADAIRVEHWPGREVQQPV